MEAAFKPIVNGDLDTQNFEKYDEVRSSLLIHFLNLFLMVQILLQNQINTSWNRKLHHTNMQHFPNVY